MMLMERLTFSIEKIRHGWFVCRFGDTEIWASNCCGHDGPRQLVKLVTEVLEGERSGGHAVFEAEPGAYILSIQGGEQVTLSLRYTKRNFQVGYPMCPGQLEELLLLAENLDLYSFASAVCDAFSAYLPKKSRDKYIGNWMTFPMEELMALRLLLGEDSRNMLTER